MKAYSVILGTYNTRVDNGNVWIVGSLENLKSLIARSLLPYGYLVVGDTSKYSSFKDLLTHDICDIYGTISDIVIEEEEQTDLSIPYPIYRLRGLFKPSKKMVDNIIPEFSLRAVTNYNTTNVRNIARFISWDINYSKTKYKGVIDDRDES